MAKKPERLHVVALHAEEDEQGRINVTLPEKVRQDHTLMLRLHHRMVDLLAENGTLDHFADDVEERLAMLGPVIVSDFVADLLGKCQTVAKKLKPPNAR